jgi:hypothetical protein
MRASPRTGSVRAVLVLLIAVGASVAGTYASVPTKKAHMDYLAATCEASAGTLGAMGCDAALKAGQLFGAVRYQKYLFSSELVLADTVLSRGAVTQVWIVE